MKKRIIKAFIVTMIVAVFFPGAAFVSNAGGYSGDDISGYDPVKNEYYSYYWQEGMKEPEKTYWQWDYDIAEDDDEYISVTYYKNTNTGAILKDGWYVINGEDVYFTEKGYAKTGFLNGRETKEGGWDLGYKNVYKTNPAGKYGDDLKKLEKVKYDWITDSKGTRYGATGYYYADSSEDPSVDSNGVAKGTWYLKGTVSYIKKNTDWAMCTIDDKKYRFESDGYIAKDLWFDDGFDINGTWESSWKYATSDGSLAVGWNEINGSWYYFGKDNVMKTSQVVDGYYLDESGTISTKTGWFNNWFWVDKGNGIWQDEWIYLDSDGKVRLGWTEIDGEWYYFGDNGVMYYSASKDGYYLTKDGTLGKGGWYQDWYWIDPEAGTWDYEWHYTYSDGSVATGWTKLNDTWYYFYPSTGIMASNAYVDGYYINKDGIIDESSTGAWYQDDKGWYFMDSNNWYPSNTGYMIDGEYYEVDENGYMKVNKPEDKKQ